MKRKAKLSLVGAIDLNKIPTKSQLKAKLYIMRAEKGLQKKHKLKGYL